MWKYKLRFSRRPIWTGACIALILSSIGLFFVECNIGNIVGFVLIGLGVFIFACLVFKQVGRDMTPRIIAPDIKIDDIRSSLALKCGPFVYCIEEADHTRIDIADVRISSDAIPEMYWNDAFACGSTIMKLPGSLLIYNQENTTLYVPANVQKPKIQKIGLTAIPYFTWANRGAGKMRVWIPKI